jgi:integrase
MNSTLAAEVLPSTPCDQALAIWFDQHKTYIRGGTVRTYRQYITTLANFFHARPLAEIGVTEVRAYQGWRKETCGATRINGELCALQMCMKEADLWTPIAKLYRPLPVPKTKVRQNMSEEEERRFLRVALDPKMPRRLLAGHCLVVMANTSMGFGELRHLRRQDVFLTDDPPFVEVNGGEKNDYRLRSIPLNFLALRSMRWIVRRWEKLGGQLPDQYILPHHARRTAQEKTHPGHAGAGPIFTEPMAHIYRAARGILKDAGLPHLDPYDMRSHAITRLLSDPNVSDQMYTEIVGHVGDAMKRRYSKQRMEKKRGAMDAMCRSQIDLCEQQAESEVLARKQQVESEVRTSLGLPEKPVGEATAERIEQTSTPQRQVPNIEHPSIQAEIDRRVALLLEDRRGRSRTSDKSLRRRLTRRRGLANNANREQVGLTRRPSAPNVVLFPGPTRINTKTY